MAKRPQPRKRLEEGQWIAVAPAYHTLWLRPATQPVSVPSSNLPHTLSQYLATAPAYHTPYLST
eukprot:1086537-Rhodomonas_salina.3